MSFVVVACFFKGTCHSIFDYLLAASFINKKFLNLVSIYFSTIKINSQGYCICIV